MSSVSSAFAQPKKLPLKFSALQTPSYVDSIIGFSMPIPFFITDNDMLDIRIQDNVQNDVLTQISILSPYIESSVKVMGGAKPVQRISNNVIVYLKNLIYAQTGETFTGTFELVTIPIMTKVQLTDPYVLSNTWINSSTPYQISDSVPAITPEYITGVTENEYRTVWIFQSPMTVKYYSTQDSKYKYLTLSSALPL